MTPAPSADRETAPPGTEIQPEAPASPPEGTHPWTVTDAAGVTVAWCASFADAVGFAAEVPHARVTGPWRSLLAPRADALGADAIALRVVELLRAPACDRCGRPLPDGGDSAARGRRAVVVCPAGSCRPRR